MADDNPTACLVNCVGCGVALEHGSTLNVMLLALMIYSNDGQYWTFGKILCEDRKYILHDGLS